MQILLPLDRAVSLFPVFMLSGTVSLCFTDQLPAANTNKGFQKNLKWQKKNPHQLQMFIGFSFAPTLRYYYLAFRAHQMPETSRENAVAILERAKLEGWVLGTTKVTRLLHQQKWNRKEICLCFTSNKYNMHQNHAQKTVRLYKQAGQRSTPRYRDILTWAKHPVRFFWGTTTWSSSTCCWGRWSLGWWWCKLTLKAGWAPGDTEKGRRRETAGPSSSSQVRRC